jgi:hypothetical protein
VTLKNLDSPYHNRYDLAFVKGGEVHGAGILLQMPEEDGNEEPADGHFEEQEASNTRNLPILWNQDVSNWQRLRKIRINRSLEAIFKSLN